MSGDAGRPTQNVGGVGGGRGQDPSPHLNDRVWDRSVSRVGIALTIVVGGNGGRMTGKFICFYLHWITLPLRRPPVADSVFYLHRSRSIYSS